MCQLAWQMIEKNRDLHILDISLDDPKRERFYRYIAQIGQIMINAIKKPNDYQARFPDMVARIPSVISTLKAHSSRLQILDSNIGTEVETIGQIIRDRAFMLRTLPVPMNLAVVLDNFHDLSTVNHGLTTKDTLKYAYIAQYISDLATECDIPIICTAEYRKLNGFRRPIVDDIREAVKIKYEAKSILLCHSDVACREEMAGVYYEQVGKEGKFPVLEVHVAKNKFSSYRGRLFFEFFPDIAYFSEPDAESRARYRAAVMANE